MLIFHKTESSHERVGLFLCLYPPKNLTHNQIKVASNVLSAHAHVLNSSLETVSEMIPFP